jgi:hypothetical protein
MSPLANFIHPSWRMSKFLAGSQAISVQPLLLFSAVSRLVDGPMADPQEGSAHRAGRASGTKTMPLS